MPLIDRARDVLVRWLGWRWAPLAAVLLGLALCSPSLTSGLAADDFFHELLLVGSDLPGLHGHPLDLFVFATGDPELGYAQQDVGMVGWWADPSSAIAYYRPLSALTHMLDYALFAESPVMMHAHSLAWFALALALLWRLYRRVSPPAWVATLCLLLYAIDDAHGFVVSWIANRNAIVTLALGLGVLLLHDRCRRDGTVLAAVGAAALWSLALLAGESAVAVLAYLFAYAVFLDEGSAEQRALSLVPYAAVTIVWRILYSAMGYGARGSGLAVDPLGDPLGFISALAFRAPSLLLGQLAFPPSDVWEFYPVIAPWLPAVMVAWAVAVIAFLVWVAWPVLRTDRVTRFWLTATVLAAVPASAQVPHDRLLLLVGVGGMGFIGRLFFALLERHPGLFAPGRRWATRATAVVLACIHVAFALYALPLRSRGPADVREMLARADRTVPDGPEVTGRTVVLLNPPADAFAGYIPMRREAESRPRPKHLRWLATGASSVAVERLDARTLRLEPKAGFLSLKSEWMQRSPRRPMPVGYTVELSDVTIRVTKVLADGRPARIEARFSRVLEHPSLVFLKWSEGGFVSFEPPPLGETVILPPVDFFALDD